MYKKIEEYIILIRIFLIGIVLSFTIGSQLSLGQNVFNSNSSSEERLDSLFVEIQKRMAVDSTLANLKAESDGLKQLVYQYNDNYTLTKNLYFLDYKLMRNQDYISRAILRYWLGVFLHNQYLNLSALDVWKSTENDLPGFLIPDYYLINGITQSDVFNYSTARTLLFKADRLYGDRDSIKWKARKQIAYTYRAEEKYDEEINFWEETIDWLEQGANEWWFITAYRSLAQAYVANKEYDNAIPYLNRTYELHYSMDPNDPEIYQYYVEIAIIFREKGENRKAIGYLKKTLKPMKKSENLKAEARINGMIAEIYLDLEKYDEAIIHNQQTLSIASKNDFEEILAEAYLVASKIDEAIGNNFSALNNYKEYLILINKIESTKGQKAEALWKRQYEVERAEKEFTLLIANEELEDFELQQLRLEKEKSNAELDLLKQKQESKDIELQNQVLKANEANQQLKISQSNLKSQQQESEIENLKKDRQITELIIENQKNKENEDKIAIEILKKDNELALMDAEKQRNVKNRARWIGGLFAIIMLIAIWSSIREYKNRKTIAAEKKKSDNLLLNILPKETADELKSTGKALPKNYDTVSVLFTDFAGFTRLSEKMDPSEVLRNLETMFSKFDEIAEQNNMERIKTIGDGYMCAGGLPLPNDDNAIKAVITGLEFLKATAAFNNEQKKAGMALWNLRIGINTGPVVAGVIGVKKFAYDIWGDTVNLASRAESHGIESQLNITENTYNKVKDIFECEHRGEIEVKSLGKVNMYIVKGYKT